MDLVISTGKTTIELMQEICKLDSGIRIVIVAGVIQAQCTAPSSILYTTLLGDSNASNVVLRRSETKTTYSA